MNGSVSCYDTLLADFIVGIVNLTNGPFRFVRSRKKREVSPPKKSTGEFDQPKATSSTVSLSQRKFLSFSLILDENKNSEVFVKCYFCVKKNKVGTIFCSCGKKLGALRDLEVRKARVVIDKKFEGHFRAHTTSNFTTCSENHKVGSTQQAKKWCIVKEQNNRAVVKGATVSVKKKCIM